MMRFLIALEAAETGFSVQVPDLAIVTYGKDIDEARKAAIDAIRINLEAYREAGREIPPFSPLMEHFENPDFKDLLFAFVELAEPQDIIAA